MGIKGPDLNMNRKVTPPLVGPYDGKDCDWCIVGDHGRCWRSVCNCPHEGWTRDPNAQGPHGLSAGGSEEVKRYKTDRLKKGGNGNKDAAYMLPGIDGAWPMT